MKKLVKPTIEEVKEEKFEALSEGSCTNRSKVRDNSDDLGEDEILF